MKALRISLIILLGLFITVTLACSGGKKGGKSSGGKNTPAGEHEDDKDPNDSDANPDQDINGSGNPNGESPITVGDDDDDDDSPINIGDDDDDDDDSVSGDDDDDDDDSSGPDIDWAKLLNPAKLQDCKDDDKIYDRKAKDCHRAAIADFDCDEAGIIDHFDSLNVNAEGALTTLIEDDYEIDQCGEYRDEPIILLYRKSVQDDTPRIRIKKICLTGSDLCKS